MRRVICQTLFLFAISLLLMVSGCVPPQYVQIVNDCPFPIHVFVSYDAETHRGGGRGEEFIATVPARTTSGLYEVRRELTNYWFRFRGTDGKTDRTLQWSRTVGVRVPFVMEIGTDRLESSTTLRWSWGRVGGLLLWVGAIGWLIFLADTLRRALRR